MKFWRSISSIILDALTPATQPALQPTKTLIHSYRDLGFNKKNILIKSTTTVNNDTLLYWSNLNEQQCRSQYTISVIVSINTPENAIRKRSIHYPVIRDIVTHTIERSMHIKTNNLNGLHEKVLQQLKQPQPE